MNETLKAAGHIGAELGAAKAEIERLRGLLREISDSIHGGGRVVTFMDDDIAAIDDALSQQAKPMCETMQRPKAQCGCPDCGSSLVDWPKAEPAPAQDEWEAHQYAFEVGGTEDGNYILMPEELDEVVRRATAPFADVLRSLACSLGAGGYNAPAVNPAVFERKIRWGIDQLTRPAQTEQQPFGDSRVRGVVDSSAVPRAVRGREGPDAECVGGFAS